MLVDDLIQYDLYYAQDLQGFWVSTFVLFCPIGIPRAGSEFFS